MKMYFGFLALFLLSYKAAESAPACNEPSSESTVTSLTEEPPTIKDYEYIPTDTGYSYSYHISNSVLRQESLEIINKGTPDEETVLDGFYTFKADDGYKYFIRYTYDKNGTTIVVDRMPIKRINPNVLKSLAG